MNGKIITLVVFFLSNFGTCHSKKYEGYTLFSVRPVEVDHLRFLQNLEKQKYIDVLFWERPHKLFYDVQLIVNPTDREVFLERANHFKIHYDVTVPNIQRIFDNQTIGKYNRLQVDTFSWNHYHTLEDIYQWLSDLALKFPSYLELNSIGKSVEGRDIYALGINRGNGKEKVIIEGGIHGHEWISTEFVTFLAHNLIFSNCTDEITYDLAMKYQWILIPVVNPDGYDFSQKEDRLWRKNKHVFEGSMGVDLNRNFNHSFGKFSASFDPKDEKFCGPVPFSEPETKALADFIYQKKENLRFYFSFHGYGEKIIIPYGDRIIHMDDYSEMENYGKQAIVKMYNLYGSKYGVGTFYDRMGLRISGNSASWVKKNFKVKYVYTILLRDNGTYGHGLPTSEILPTCKEMLLGVTEIMTAKPRRLRTDLFSSTANSATSWLYLHCFFIMLLQ